MRKVGSVTQTPYSSKATLGLELLCWAGPWSSGSLHRQSLAKVGETGLSSGLAPFTRASVDLGRDLNLDLLEVSVILLLKPVKIRVGPTVVFLLPPLELHTHVQA